MKLRRTLERIVRELSSIDLHQVRFIPEGADDPLTPVPDVVNISPADVEAALDEWDELFPDYANLLDAEVRGRKEF